jgi:hypothetical protein
MGDIFTGILVNIVSYLPLRDVLFTVQRLNMKFYSISGDQRILNNFKQIQYISKSESVLIN